MLDITHRFLAAAHALPPTSPVLSSPAFTSMDAMNALVVGDPRMDPNAQPNNLSDDTDEEAAADALLALEVAWHQGSSLIETLMSSRVLLGDHASPRLLADAALCRASLLIAWQTFAHVSDDVLYDGEDVMLDGGGIDVEQEMVGQRDEGPELRRALLAAMRDPTTSPALLAAIARRRSSSPIHLSSRYFSPRPASRLRQFMPMPKPQLPATLDDALDGLRDLALGLQLETRLDPQARPDQWRMVLRAAKQPMLAYTRARLSLLVDRRFNPDVIARYGATEHTARRLSSFLVKELLARLQNRPRQHRSFLALASECPPQLASLRTQLFFDALLAALDLDLLAVDERRIAQLHVLPALADAYREAARGDGDEIMLAWGSGRPADDEPRLRAFMRRRLNLDGNYMDDLVARCRAARPERPFDSSRIKDPLLDFSRLAAYSTP